MRPSISGLLSPPTLVRQMKGGARAGSLSARCVPRVSVSIPRVAGRTLHSMTDEDDNRQDDRKADD